MLDLLAAGLSTPSSGSRASAPLLAVGRIIPGVDHSMSIVQLDDLRYDLIKKIPVMGNDENGTAVV